MRLRIAKIVVLVLIVLGVSYLVVKHYNFFDINKPKLVDYSYRNQIRLEIINCSGIDKQGQRMQDYLRNIGFDVYGVRSGRRDIEHTTVIERVNPDMKNALEVNHALAFSKKVWLLPVNKKIEPEIQKDLDSLLYLEVTLILGKDSEMFLKAKNQ